MIGLMAMPLKSLDVSALVRASKVDFWNGYYLYVVMFKTIPGLFAAI